MADKRQRLILELVAQGAAQLQGDLKNIQDLLTAHTKAAQDSGKAITDAIAKENQAVAELIKQQNELQKVANETRNKQLASQAESTKAAQDARAAIQAQTQAIKDSNAQYGAMKDQLTGLVGLATSVFTISTIKNYATEAIDAKTKVDLFSLSLTSLLGNKKKADEIAAQVFEIAKKSPFEVEQLITVTQKLKAMGVETDKLIPYIKALGDISAFVGTDKLPFMAKAMVDVQNKGKLMAQEINQFSNAGVPLFDLLAKSMGKTKEAVIEMAKEHTISFAMVEKAILGATEKGGAYYNGMANSAKSLGGQVSNLSDLFFLGKAKLGDYFENGLQKGITIIGDFLKATVGSNGAIQRTISTLETGLAIWLSYKVAVIATNASLKANEASTLAEMGAVSASNAVKRTTIATLYQQIAGNTALTTAQRSKMMGQILDMEAEIAANAVKVTGVGITGSLTGAMHGLNLAIKANPWGFLISAVGLAYAAFTSYKALTQEVSAVESEHLTMLNKTKVAFESELTALSNTIVGTKDRREAVAKIQLQYPDYLKNINLEFATQQDLAKVLARVNGQLERKIQLAAQDARTEQFRQTSIELYNKQGDVVDKLRDKYGDLSKAYIDNVSFLAAVNKEATKLTTNTHVGMGQYVKTVNTDALELIGTYKELGAEIQKSNAKIQGSLQQTNLLTANDMKATANQFAKDLKERQFDLKRLRDIGVLNDTKYKEQWNLAVADYKKDIKSLSNEQIKTNETTLNKVGDDTKKANKAKAETHSATAKEINLIEAQSNAKRLDMSKQLSKDELKVLQDLAKAEYAVDVEKVNKKYKTAKDGKEKISAEIIKLDQILFDKLEKIDKEQSKKKEAENERRTKYKETELEKETRKELAELDEKLLKQAKKELTEAEKLDDQLEKLNKEYRESQARLEDAQNLKRELATAKTATERYAITVKYGKKTNDELLAMEIVRMQKEQKMLNDKMIALAKDNKQNTDEYRKLQEAYLRISTDINDKITAKITKEENERLKTYQKVYNAYKFFIEGTFKVTTDMYDKLLETYQNMSKEQLSTLDNQYEIELKLAGDNYGERIKITENYTTKVTELLTSSYNKEKVIASMRDISNAIGQTLEQEFKIYENYHTKKKALEDDNTRIKNDSEMSASEKSIAIAKNEFAKKVNQYTAYAGAVATIVTNILSTEQKARDREFQYQTDINDATQKNYKKLYDEKVSMATQTHEKAIALIREEERLELESLQTRLGKELEIVAIKYNAKFALLEENKNRELKIHEINNAEYQKLVDKRAKDELDKLQALSDATLEETKKKLDREYAEKLRYVELADRLKQQDFESFKFWYDKEIEAAGNNEEEKKKLTEQYQKDIADAEKYWSDYKIQAQKDADEAKKINAEAVAQAEKDAKVKFEKDKAQIVLKTEAELEAERLVKIEERRLHDIAVEDQKNKDALEILEKAKKDAIEKEKEYWVQASENRRIQYEKDLLAAGTDDEAKKKLTEQYLLDKQDLEDRAKFAIEVGEKQHNKIIEEEMQRHTDDKRIIEYKYDQWVIDKKKQYEDERQEIIEKAEKKRTETIALAEQDRVIATNIANQAKEVVVSNANDRILEADYLYQQALFKGEKEYIRQSLELQLERNEKQAEYNKATITSNLWAGASNAVANGNVVGGLVGAFNALVGGSDYRNDIEAQRATARLAIQGQINANNNRVAPDKVTNTRKVIYNRGIELEDANSYTDFLTNPLAAQGHETPIDYINGRGVRLAVYEWIPTQQGDTIVYNPRFRRNFKDGSNYVERGSNPQGIDQIPAMVNEGEKIFTTEQSRLMGGKNVDNKDIVKKVQMHDFIAMKMPNLMQIFDMPRMKIDSPSGGFSDVNMIKAMERMEKAIIDKKTSNVNINVDKYKIDVEEQMGDSLIKYRNATYNRNN
jgi:tape measure domain-containing protein